MSNMGDQSKQAPQSMDVQLSPGQILQTERMAQKMDTSDIAAKMRLSEQYIKDLEVDDYSHIGARIYARGYLLGYAKLLGVEESRILHAIESVKLPEQPAIVQPKPLHVHEPKVKTKSRQQPRSQMNSRWLSLLKRFQWKFRLNTQLRPKNYYKRYVSRWLGFIGLIVLILLVVVWWQNQKKHINASATVTAIHPLTKIPTKAAPVLPLAPVQVPLQHPQAHHSAATSSIDKSQEKTATATAKPMKPASSSTKKATAQAAPKKKVSAVKPKPKPQASVSASTPRSSSRVVHHLPSPGDT